MIIGPVVCSGRAFVHRKTGKEVIHYKRDVVMREGDKLYMRTPGGGGFSDPLKRKPELVLKDVKNQKIAFASAEEDYGVVIDQESMTVDCEKIRILRDEKAKLREPVT